MILSIVEEKLYIEYSKPVVGKPYAGLVSISVSIAIMIYKCISNSLIKTKLILVKN